MRFGYGYARAQRFRRLKAMQGGTPAPAGDPPVNTDLPFFVTQPIEETPLWLNMGTWESDSAITQFELEIRSVEGTPVVYFARQVVTEATEPLITGAVGKSLELRVWCTNAGGTTLATSLPSDPVAAAGDTLIGAFAWARTPFSLPAGWTHILAPSGIVDTSYRFPNIECPNGVTAGWSGTNVALANINDITTADNRRRGRYNLNNSPVQFHFRFEGLIPGQTYKLFAALGNTSVVNCTFDVTDEAGNVLLSRPTVSVPANEILDAAGNVTNYATWNAASEYGGQHAIITAPASGIIRIHRPQSYNAGIQLNCIALLEEA